MRSFILTLLALFTFSGCFTSSLSMNSKKELVFNYNTNEMLLSSRVISSELLNFKDLYVNRYKLEDENGRTIFYEVAKTTMSYEFNYGGLYTTMYIFDDSKKYESVYEKNNLSLVQIELKDASYLNLIIQASSSHIYTFAYGFSNAEFLQIANRVIENDSLKLKELKHDAITFTPSDPAKSNWSDEVVFFAPLIIPNRALNSK